MTIRVKASNSALAPQRPEKRRPEILRAILGAILLSMAPACATGSAQGTSGMIPSRTEAARQLFLFQYSPGPAWRTGVPMREQGLGGHAAYMQRLQAEGRLFAGGGYTSDDGGMAIILAGDSDEARAILAEAPAITSGIFVAELRHWVPRFRVETPLPASS